MPDEVIERTRPHEQEEEFPIPGGVKNVAADEQPDLARPVFAQRPVDAKDREKKPEEAEFYEKHGEVRARRLSPLLCLKTDIRCGLLTITGSGSR